MPIHPISFSFFKFLFSGSCTSTFLWSVHAVSPTSASEAAPETFRGLAWEVGQTATSWVLYTFPKKKVLKFVLTYITMFKNTCDFFLFVDFQHFQNHMLFFGDLLFCVSSIKNSMLSWCFARSNRRRWLMSSGQQAQPLGKSNGKFNGCVFSAEKNWSISP